MGKKRVPLRSSLGKRSLLGTVASLNTLNNDSVPIIAKKGANYWKKIEKLQNDERAASEDSNDDTEDDGENNDSDIRLDGSLEHVVENYTFEFNDMRDEFTEGICTMLRTFISNPTEAYNLAITVTSQTIVGTVVNCEGGQDSFAFATVLPLQNCEPIVPLKAILSALLSSIDKVLSIKSSAMEEYLLVKNCLSEFDHNKKISAESLDGSTTTGMLLHRRFTNLPIELIGALHRNLEEDISWAQQQANEGHQDDESCTASVLSPSKLSTCPKINSHDNKSNFFVSARYVIMLCPCKVSRESKSFYKLSGGNGENNCYSILGSSNVVNYDCFEDEVYMQHASAAILFRPPKQYCPVDTDLVALLIHISKLKSCVNGICSLIL